MKRLMVFVLMGLMSLTLFSEDINVKILADDGYAPYSYVEGGQLKGIYVDILKEAAAKVEGYKIELRGIPWKRGLKEVEKGTSFGLVPPYYRPVQRPFLNPYSVPILEEKVVVVAVEEKVKADMKWPDSFKGWKIGSNDGFSFAEKEKEKGIVKIVTAKNNQINILKLSKNRIDAYANDEVSIFWSLKKLKESGKYPANGPELKTAVVVKEEKGYIGYSRDFKSPWKEDFIKKMDKALKEVIEAGVVEKVMQKYR